VVVLDDPTALADGTCVQVQPLQEAAQEGPSEEKALLSLSEKLLRLAGTVNGLPADMARNHDHYLHGHPKK
jgi:hypothetical protein